MVVVEVGDVWCVSWGGWSHACNVEGPWRLGGGTGVTSMCSAREFLTSYRGKVMSRIHGHALHLALSCGVDAGAQCPQSMQQGGQHRP